jgi:hypothetical protein
MKSLAYFHRAPASGPHAREINKIWALAKKAAKKGENTCKYASVGDKWRD